jgi:hypothetical protein
MAQDSTRDSRGDEREQEPILDPAEEELYAGTKIDSEAEALASEEAVEAALAVDSAVLPADTEVQGAVYTMGRWRVPPEQQAAFIAAWHALGTVFRNLSHPPIGHGVLVQSVDEPDLFYSFGPWQSLADIEAMRQHADAQAALAALRAYCSEATAGAYRLVAQEGASEREGLA